MHVKNQFDLIWFDGRNDMRPYWGAESAGPDIMTDLTQANQVTVVDIDGSDNDGPKSKVWKNNCV